MLKRLIHTLIPSVALFVAVFPAFSQSSERVWIHSGTAPETRASYSVSSPLVMTREAVQSSEGIASVPATLPAPCGEITRKDYTGNITIMGNVIYSDKPAGSTAMAHVGMYDVTLSGQFTGVKPTTLGGGWAAVLLDGIYYNYYGVQNASGTITYYARTYNTKTWAQLSSKTITQANIPVALCTDGKSVYGIFFQENAGEDMNYVLASVDVKTNTHTNIMPLPSVWNACAYGNDGMIYAIDMFGDFYKIDINGKTCTKVGATGAVPQYVSGATVDRNSGRMFWTVAPADKTGRLYEINISTGKGTQLCQFEYNDEIVGIYVPFEAYDKAPASPSNLSVDFKAGSLVGNVAFDCPSTTYDGTTVSGKINYTISANGTDVATGEASYGTRMNVPVTLEAGGATTIAVRLANDVGASPETEISFFAGPDTPKPVKASLSYKDGCFNLQWTPAQETVNGGYMDLDNVKYTVTRYPGTVKVAESIAACSFSEPMAVSETYTKYYYTVVAECDGKKSGVATSNTMPLGNFNPPYSETFDAKTSLDNFIIVDNNGDAKTWLWDTNKRVKANTGSTIDNDDWLILPALRLEKGKSYRITAEAKNQGVAYPEKLMVKMGRTPLPEDMKTILVDTLHLTDNQKWVEIEAFALPDEDADYFIAFHAVSPMKSYYLHLDNVSVSAAGDTGVPDVATDVKVTPDPQATLKATVSGKAPEKNIAGGKLENISKIEIKRDGTLVTSLTGITPGAPFSYTDGAVPTNGIHEYSVICHTETGAGLSVSASAYIGVEKPAPVTNVVTRETAPGVITVTWDAPATDVAGRPLNPASLTYKVVNAQKSSEIYGNNLTERTFTYTVTTGEQKFVVPGVHAINAVGTSDGTPSTLEAVGNPYPLPYSESFANGAISSIIGMMNLEGNGGKWSIYKDGSVNGILSADNDNGMMVCTHPSQGDAAMILTGKIDLTKAINPRFSFYLYNIVSVTDGKLNRNVNEIDAMVSIPGSGEWKSLLHNSVDELCEGDTMTWKKITVNLDDYKGKVVQLGVKTKCNFFIYTFLDQLSAFDILDHNLAVKKITAPDAIRPNEPYNVNVEVANNGIKKADGYTVELFRNSTSEPFMTFTGTPLEAGETKLFSAPDHIGFDDEDGKVAYFARVTYSADQNNADNVSDTIYTERKYTFKPVPKALVMTTSKRTVTLQWQAPDLSNGTGIITDDVENYESWAYEKVGDWTFVDVDQKGIGGFSSFDIPNNPLRSNRAFFIFDKQPNQSPAFDAYSGTKFFASMMLYETGAVNDWLISPPLCEKAQTISFHAKSYSSIFLEKIEMLYSTTGKETADFKVVKGVNKVPNTWTKYTFDIPQGAKYFAIRSLADDAFMLMLDDFTYEGEKQEVIGYNVYRDGVRINAGDVASTGYVDANCTSGNHKYHVTALYTDGEESAPSDPATVNVGVDNVYEGAMVIAGKGFIKICNADGAKVAITDIAGITLYNSEVADEATITLPKGIYLVNLGNRIEKVSVR